MENKTARTPEQLEGITLLGNQNTNYLYEYNPAILETFENKHMDNDYMVTFDAYEFTSLCLTGDTLIEVVKADGGGATRLPIKDLVGTERYTYGVNPDTLHKERRRYYDVRKTQENVPVVEITIEKMDIRAFSGVSAYIKLVCTPNHLVLVNKHGAPKAEWVEAKDLQPHMRLVSLQDADSGVSHGVMKVVDAGTADVYNMEVEDIHNFFANEVIVHNCPKTGQPDFAKIYINYIPDERMVESKSLKLYLFSFRNHGDFHEDCINIIMKDLVKLMDPKYIEVLGVFAPRGGISIYPFANYAQEGSIYEQYKSSRLFEVATRNFDGKKYN